MKNVLRGEIRLVGVGLFGLVSKEIHDIILKWGICMEMLYTIEFQ